MEKLLWLVSITVVGFVFVFADDSFPSNDLASTVKLLQEQVTALLEHRQEEYNALEDSLKKAMEKNTELLVLKNEVKLLRFVFCFLYSNTEKALDFFYNTRKQTRAIIQYFYILSNKLYCPEIG